MHINKTEKIEVTVGNIIFTLEKGSGKVNVAIDGYPTIDVEDIHELHDASIALGNFIQD